MTDKIFDIIYSLPTISHSVAIATRCLADGRQRRYSTKYMPDFGGVLDIPEFVIKNNALSKGIPFDKRSLTSLISMTKHQETCETPVVSECLVVNSYLETIDEDEFVVIRALGNVLDFNLIKQQAAGITCEDDPTLPFATLPYSNKITGIRYFSNIPGLLIIKFDQELKIIRLNHSYSVTSTSNERPAIDLHASLARNDRYLIKDACLNQNNLSMQAIVVDDCRNECCFEIYDISTESKTPIHTIQWTSDESRPIAVKSKFAYVTNKMVGGPSVRTLVPTSKSKGVQHIEKIPKHLLNYVVTTGYKTSLIDPRCNEISLVLLDKTQLMSFYPLEYCKSSLFSNVNDYQFYSLSNITVRALDMRYPGTPVNQVSHMLDSSDYNYMNLKLIGNPISSQVETLCASSSDSICFLTFDQAKVKKFINPKSLHQPYHDTTFNRSTEANMKCMHGLDVITQNLDEVEKSTFSVFQLNNNSDLYWRDFSFTQDFSDDPIVNSTEKIDMLPKLKQPKSNSQYLIRLEEDGTSSSSKVTKCKQNPSTRVLDILNEDEYQEENLPSHAALLRFESMMEKLRKS